MSDQGQDSNSTSGATDSAASSEAPARTSIREAAEAAYNEVSEQSSEDTSVATDRGDGRDARGRFAAKDQPQETGEAEPAEAAPSPEKQPEAQTQPEPAAQQRASTQLPEHWSAEDRAEFTKWPQGARDMFLRRYGEMEADYTRKSQANAMAVQALNAIAPVFQDQEITQSLAQTQMSPIQAINEWAAFHKRGINPDPRVRAGLLYDLAQRMGFDPARLFAPRQSQGSPGVPEAILQDPKLKYLVDQLGRRDSDLQAVQSQLQQIRAAEQQKQEGEVLRQTRWTIDQYADEKDASGRPLRPHFDKVINAITDMFKINPDKDLDEAYQQACWMDPEVRKLMMQEQFNAAASRQSNQRAAQAARSNVRGITSPVSKPTPAKTGNGSLRDTLEASADEVGL